MFETFIIALIFFTLGVFSVLFVLMAVLLVVFWKTIMGLSGGMNQALAGAIETGFEIAKDQAFKTVYNN